jgi:DNA-binding CsgD family transcriptional regulator
MVSAEAFTRLNTATLALFAPGLHLGNYVARAHAFIATLLPTDLSGYGALDDKSGQLDARFDHHPLGLQSSLEAYGMHMHKYAPFRFDPSVNGGRPYSARDFFTKAKFHDLDIYQEVHRPLGFEDHCFVHVPTEAGTTLFFGLFREGLFRKADKELLELGQPHLANARQLAIAQSRVIDLDFDPGIFTGFGFSPRESEILHCIIQGQTNAEIAYDRRLRLDTVSGYIRSIYVKMGVNNRVAAVIHALTLVRSAVYAQKDVAFHVTTARMPRGGYSPRKN